ncbi:hypothetical protein [Microvirga sp. M2]|uniref:hypothetical protein n=1 Tax=Microvirga sp. M2 TaxID=3073270 RepID=UPI0039C4BABF
MRGPDFDDPPVFRVDLLAPFRPVDDAAARRLVAPAAVPVFLTLVSLALAFLALAFLTVVFLAVVFLALVFLALVFLALVFLALVFLALVLAAPVLAARFTTLLDVAARVLAAGRADAARVVFATRPERAGVVLDVVAERRTGVFRAAAVVLRAIDAVLRALDGVLRAAEAVLRALDAVWRAAGAVLRAAVFLATPVLDDPAEDARCDVLFFTPARLAVPAVRPPEVPVWRELLLRPSAEAEDARAVRFVPALFAVPDRAVAFPTFRVARVDGLLLDGLFLAGLFLEDLTAGRLAGAASVAMNLKKRLV